MFFVFFIKCFFLSLHKMEEFFSKDTFVHAASGSIGGNIAMVLTYPLDQLRVELQVRNVAWLRCPALRAARRVLARRS